MNLITPYICRGSDIQGSQEGFTQQGGELSDYLREFRQNVCDARRESFIQGNKLNSGDINRI
jgi:hypothetical protein